MAANHTEGHVESLHKLLGRIDAGHVNLDHLRNHKHNVDGMPHEQVIPLNHAVATAPMIDDFHDAAVKFNGLEKGITGDAKTHYDHFNGEIADATAAIETKTAGLASRKAVKDAIVKDIEKDWSTADAAHKSAIKAKADALTSHQAVVDAAYKSGDQVAIEKAGKTGIAIEKQHNDLIETAEKKVGVERRAADEKLAAARKPGAEGVPSVLTQAESEITKHEGELKELKTKRAAKVQAKHDYLSGKEVEIKVKNPKFVEGGKEAQFITKKVKCDPTLSAAYTDAHGKFGKIADSSKFHAPKVEGAVAEAAKDGEKAGMFAKAKANGFFKTAGENMNVFAKDAAGERRLGMKSARIAGVGAGLYVAGKGVGQLFSGNEEDSKLMAVGKIVVGLGGAGVAAVAGR